SRHLAFAIIASRERALGHAHTSGSVDHLFHEAGGGVVGEGIGAFGFFALTFADFLQATVAAFFISVFRDVPRSVLVFGRLAERVVLAGDGACRCALIFKRTGLFVVFVGDLRKRRIGRGR